MLLVLLCGEGLKSQRLGITWCDIHVSVWISAVWTRCIRHSELISTNGLLYIYISSDFDKVASLCIIIFIDFCLFKADVSKNLNINLFAILDPTSE
jgi:hypothetical protein